MRKEGVRLLKSTVAIALVVIIVSVVMDMFAYGMAKIYDNKLSDVNKKIQDKISEGASKAAFDTVQGKIDYRIKLLKKIDSSKFNIVKLLDQIEVIAPKDLTLSTLSVNNSGLVSIQGSADTEESVLDFYHSIKETGLYNEITFNGINGSMGVPRGDNGKKGFEFQITFKFKSGK